MLRHLLYSHVEAATLESCNFGDSSEFALSPSALAVADFFAFALFVGDTFLASSLATSGFFVVFVIFIFFFFFLLLFAATTGTVCFFLFFFFTFSTTGLNGFFTPRFARIGRPLELS